MDKNTITGLVLIALLFVGFSYFSRPSQEQIDAQRKYYDSIEVVNQKMAELEAKAAAATVNEARATLADSTSLFFSAANGEQKFTTIQNDLVELTIDNKGGRVYSALLKDYKGQDANPVVLFNANEASMNFVFYNNKGEAVQTDNYYFDIVNPTDSSVTMRLAADSASFIDFKYTLSPESYLVDFQIDATNMANKLAATKYINIFWTQHARQIEQGYTYEARLSELTYKIKGESTKSLSNSKDEKKNVEETLDWIGFKNQFFSSVFIADQNFNDVVLASKVEKQGTGYIKDYSAEMTTFFDPSGQTPTDMYFYFGPNHFKTLKALDKGRVEKWKLDNLVYLGWPVVRELNKYVIINIFDWLTKWGLGMGIVLLLLTLVVKAAVFPATWKTYVSSAKMRVLKPKIEEINKKYPNKEDAMQKQQETFALYKQYGVNPMGGCLPMLLQAPILMALFMFVPSAIELRQQSFLWVDDLSTYDAFISLPFNIPFLGDHISLFCLLMTVTNMLNTKYMMQQQGDGAYQQMPAMKYMMYLMPVMFFFILNDYPSGLNYYYFLSTLISVATTIIMRRTTNEEKLLNTLEANKKTTADMKKGFMSERLEALQQQQKQMMEERSKRQKK